MSFLYASDLGSYVPIGECLERMLTTRLLLHVSDPIEDAGEGGKSSFPSTAAGNYILGLSEGYVGLCNP